MSYFIAVVLNFVAAYDVVQSITLQEGVGDVRPELAAHAALGRRAP